MRKLQKKRKTCFTFNVHSALKSLQAVSNNPEGKSVYTFFNDQGNLW